MIKSLQDLKRIVKKSLFNLYKDEALNYSAAMSFYVILALPIFLLIVVSIGGIVWGEPIIKQQLLTTISNFTGIADTMVIENLLNQAFNFNAEINAIYSAILLILAAGAIFSHLHISLNNIYGVKEKRGDIIRKFLLRRLFAFILLIVLGLVLIFSLILQGIFSLGLEYISPYIYLSESVFLGLSVGIELVLLFFIFLSIYKIIPDIKFAWRDAVIGSIVTTLLFALGSNIISLYAQSSDITTAYGAAGSLVVLLLWVYYSSLLIFFGAEFTQYYAMEAGEGVEPKDNARFKLDQEKPNGIIDEISHFIKKWYENK
ncbi:MAG: hypothetical protein BRC22_01215 [Parcubacteria group bacterium QH_9_35_7]|nr:MAG: hypothetical protein BRC22_01215 [Parcubacteria group bacterium QH_9_35_7]